ncbi:hypothetical protein NFI96_012162 [Prochilodus magdalenae]|nr:hypothetical protein NFI96_012162 [Prochilodus magdalenae]
MAESGRYYSDVDGVSVIREVWSNDGFPGEHDDRVGGPQFRNRKGRGPFRGRVPSEPIRQRLRGGPVGGFGPGPRSRIEDEDGDVTMSDGQDGASQRRFNPYGRPNRRYGRFDRDKGGGGGGYRSAGGGGALGDTSRLGGGLSSEKSRSWFKITIPYGKKYDKKWLLTALQNLCPVPFSPIHVIVFMNPCPPPSFLQCDLKEQDLEHLKQCMSKRFDHSEQYLDLNGIRTDPALVSQNIEMILSRKSCMQAVVKIIEENIPELVCLNLSNNRLYKLDELTELVNKAPNIKKLNLSHNELKSERELDKVKGFKLTELWLDRNPLCDHFKDQSTYISAIRERFPRLLKLDGHDLPASIGFDVETGTTIPPCKGSYFGSDEIKEFILRFLQQYYSVYDSGDRQPLLDAYHEAACFSLSLPFSMHNPSRSSLGDYHKHSRNIKKVKDPATRFRLLKHNRLNVVAFLNELPKTQHDTASFIVDVNTYTQTLLVFTVGGVFKEVDGKARDSVRAFSRVFIAVPAINSGLCLVNDELFVRNATTEEIRRAFAAPAPTPSSSPVPTLSASQLEMLSAFSQKSEMNLEWSQKCLQHSEWDFNRAVQIFTELKPALRVYCYAVAGGLLSYTFSSDTSSLPNPSLSGPMSRWFFPWSGSIKKRACRYLLQHYLGHFLEERLSLEQLSLDLYNGSGVIKEINLDVWAVNELLESLGAPLEIVEGFVQSIAVTIPWAALVTDHCTLEVTGLQITCRPKYRTSGSWDSQGWSSCMTSSMQLAQECLKDPPEASEDPPAPLEGLEMFAQTIETVLRRIKVTFLDTIVRIEHQPLDSETGVALEMRITRLDYCDEAVRDSNQTVPVDIHQPPAFLHKILQLNSVKLLYETLGEPQGPFVPENTQGSDDDDVVNDEEKNSAPQPLRPHPEPLLIGNCSGFMETTVKIKQNDMLPGPKLELDGKMGCLHLLLSPSQIIHLTELLAALCIETEGSSNTRGGVGIGGHSRPLGSDDLRLIEEDLSKQLSTDMAERDLELDADPYVFGLENGEMFYSMGPGCMTSSVMSARSGSELSDSDMESSVHSQSSLAQTHPLSPQGMLNCPRRYPVPGTLSSLPQCSRPPRRSSHGGQAESMKPDSLFRLSLGGVTLTLLEQEPPMGPDGQSSLAEVSKVFFHELAFFKDSMFSERDFQNLRGSFAKACPHSHLRLTGAAVQVTCEMRSSGHHAHSVTSDLSFSRLELLECLWEPSNPQYIELLQFQTAGLFTVGATARPCAQLHYSLTEKHQRKSGLKQRVVRRDSSVRIELGELTTEVDLDTLGRLDSIIQALSHCPSQPSKPAHIQTQLLEVHSSLTLLSPHAVLRLRFPIPDLRPLDQRRPISERAVRKEVLNLEMSNLELKSQQGPDIQETPSTPSAKLIQLLEATFSDMHGVYEGWEGDSFPCIRVQKSTDSQNPDGTPRIVVRVSGEPGMEGQGVVDVGLNRDFGLGSMSMENPCRLREKNSSPFSSNRTMFETEEMVIPADPEEMKEFQSQCVAQCQYVVDIILPVAYILLPSKESFQSIYNRINNDLLMWEPPPAPPSPTKNFHSPLQQHRSEEDEFQLCKSAFRLESDSEEEEPQFHSASNPGKRGPLESPFNHALSLLCLTVLIGKGRIQAMMDTKNEAGRRVEQCHGELLLDIEGGKIFSVTQHQNNPNLNFLTIESKKVELYHKAEIPDSPLPVRLDMPRFAPPNHLDPTIYPTEVGVSSVSGRGTGGQMLSTAIKITLDLQRNVKEFLVALRLQGATLRHHMALTNYSWHEQLVDFLDVIDDDILGYTPPAIITVLHTHLATCAVDYRPLYLPLRVLFTAESFSLSSNIIVDTATFHLRFILDDSALYLTDKCENETVDLRRDYVCVLDIDLLELAITTWKGNDAGKLTQPLFELRCSNNVVHVRTCADSCAALVNMLQYLVSQGDLHPPPRHTSPTEIAGQKLPLSEAAASLPPCPPAETAEINQCDLTDALIDTERSQHEEDQEGSPYSVKRGSPVSVYFFPGEAPKSRSSVLEGDESELDRLVVTATEAQADMLSEEGSEGSTDNDDFCILEAPGMGIPPKDGEPVVTVLCQGPIKVRDGYFSRPRGSSDLLRAPSRFPVPQSRVVLREVSVVWHLYGGKDFGGKPTSAHTQHSHRGRSAPPGARGSPSRSAGSSRPQNSWRWVGGSGRQHSLLMEIQLTKVSFQHESYLVVAPPAVQGQDVEGTGIGEQPLSRQVFIVQELEVRDRLASSQINKFLYLYTSESMPRRAHSNMLTVKALQVLPESGLGGPECCLRVSLLPLRLNIDQDALFFLKDFFSNLAAGVNPYLPVDPAAEVKADTTQKQSEEAEPGLGPDLTASVETTFSEQSSSSAGSTSSSDQPIYFREFRFTSEVPIWLDYQGKHVAIEQGTFAGILIGLAQLNCSELKLKRLCCRHGLLGVDKVIQYAVNEWLTDIRKNQLPGILGGVGPMHSVVQLFHGVRDLFWMPIEQYRRDGRIIRGLQRGAASFGTSTASAALELSNRLVQAIQATAETVYDILSPTPPLTRCITEGRPISRPRRTPQPADLREGVAKAYDTVREGVIDTAQTLCDVASRGHEQKGLPGAVGGVLRQIPPTVVRPLIVASEATSNLLGGMRNQIKPDARKEDFLKWRIEDGQE